MVRDQNHDLYIVIYLFFLGDDGVLRKITISVLSTAPTVPFRRFYLSSDSM